LEEPSSREKENRYAQRKSIHFNRAFGGHCHYCVVDGDIDACSAASEEAGTSS
jgi:hypothetical protein